MTGVVPNNVSMNDAVPTAFLERVWVSFRPPMFAFEMSFYCEEIGFSQTQFA